MNRMAAAGSAFLVILCALALAACGGGMTKQEYEAEMERIGNDVDKAMQGVSANDEDRLRRSREELIEGIDRIDDLEPPEEVQGAHDDLVRGLRGFAELMEKYEGLDPQNPENEQQAMKLIDELQDEDSPLRDIEQAQRKFQDAGYDVFGASDASAGGK